jgi:aminodeoxyfutalosine synthase
LVRRIRAARPGLWIKAFTAVEVAYFARMSRVDHAAVIAAMKEAGVNAMPGGGAEVLSDRLHRELFPDKIGPEKWLSVHRTAHLLGLPTNCTLLFGHIETDEEIIDHLFALRSLQDDTSGFQSVIPLAYQPGQTRLVPRMASAPRCLRVIALARLMLDNVPHVKAYWPALHIETAAAALSFGADDLDGTLGRERIMQQAQTAAPASLSARRAEWIIRDAGQTPVARDGAFRPVGAETASCRGVA